MDIGQRYRVLFGYSSRFQAAADQVYAGLYKRGFISTSSVIARRRDILAVKGFDTSLTVGQDFDPSAEIGCRLR